jgi:hypothetical protein
MSTTDEPRPSHCEQKERDEQALAEAADRLVDPRRLTAGQRTGQDDPTTADGPLRQRDVQEREE